MKKLISTVKESVSKIPLTTIHLAGSLVFDFRDLLRCIPHVKISHLMRESNMAADILVAINPGLSKTLAEKAAWKFAEENGIDLVAINPGLVIGPLLQPTVNLSVDFIIDIVNGRQLPPFNRFVDVRDVAFSHILAFEVPSASGRYCMVERTADFSEVLKILDELYPDLHLSEKFKDKDVGTLLKVSNYPRRKQ